MNAERIEWKGRLASNVSRAELLTSEAKSIVRTLRLELSPFADPRKLPVDESARKIARLAEIRAELLNLDAENRELAELLGD